MVKAFTAIMLSIITMFVNIGNAFIKVEAPEDTTEFTPVVRFMVASDTHIEYGADKLTNRVMKAIKLSYAIADADEEYNKLDAALFCGDISNNGRRDQFCSFKSATDAVLRDETELVALIAKSHDGTMLGKNSLEYFSNLTGLDNDIHTVINGFHFITLSASKTEGEHYSEYQRTWLKAQLDAAVKDDPTKPIFVAQHEHVKNTVYGSSDFDGWGMDYFTDIFNQYPQIVHFSGHSHYPVNDPRSVWQGEFTAIGTGAVKYLEFTVDDDRCVHPKGNHDESEFWIVEVDANNRIRLRAMDLIEQQVLCEYIIDGPLSRDYTPEKRAASSTAPVFTNTDVKLKNKNLNCKVTVNRAESTDGMPVFLYRAYALDKDGNELKMEYYIPRYYSYTLDDTATITLGKLPKGTTDIKVTAETAYGVQSEPIIVSVK